MYLNTKLRSGMNAAFFQHAWPDLFVVVKREHEVGPIGTGERSMGARLTLDHPSDPQKGRQHPSSTGAGPRAHAALKEMLSRSGPASPFSRRSAITLRARAWTRESAACSVSPYARTPGNSTTSASHRPSSSRSISTLSIINGPGPPSRVYDARSVGPTLPERNHRPTQR